MNNSIFRNQENFDPDDRFDINFSRNRARSGHFSKPKTIRYLDHLTPIIGVARATIDCMIKPNNLLFKDNFEFDFIIVPNNESIMQQSKAYAKLFFSDSKLARNVEVNTAFDRNRREENIADSYIYSYLKAISLILKFKTQGYRSVGMLPSDYLMYHGHKILVTTFINSSGYSNLETRINSLSVKRNLDLDIDATKSIISKYPQFRVSESSYDIENSNLERMLSSLRSDVSDIIVSYCDDMSDFQKLASHSPLGNSFYRSCKESKTSFIYSVNSERGVMDPVSKFWNLANCVHLKSLPSNLDEGACVSDSFMKINSEQLASEVFFPMVTSVTNISSLSKYSYGTDGISYNNQPYGGNLPSGSKGNQGVDNNQGTGSVVNNSLDKTSFGDKTNSSKGGKNNNGSRSLNRVRENRFDNVLKAIQFIGGNVIRIRNNPDFVFSALTNLCDIAGLYYKGDRPFVSQSIYKFKSLNPQLKKKVLQLRINSITPFFREGYSNSNLELHL